MNKNNPFSGGKQCFCKQTNKKTKRKERFRANCPKTHVQGCVDPSSRRKRRKEQNTKRREGIFKRSLFKFAKTVSKKEHRKTRKNHPHRSRKQISGNGPNRTQTATELQKRKRAKNFTNWAPPGQNGKNVILKISSVLQPQAVFFAFQTQIGQKFELPKKQICETPKNLCQKCTAASRRYNGSNANQPGPTTQNCSETPCFEGFRVLLPLGLRLEEPRPETHAKNENFSGPQKTTSTTSKMAFLKNPKNPKTVRKLDFRKPQKTISRYKNSGFKKGGPQMNAWGAANERSRPVLGGRKWTQ